MNEADKPDIYLNMKFKIECNDFWLSGCGGNSPNIRANPNPKR